MTKASLIQQATQHSEVAASYFETSTQAAEQHESCARVNAWQQVMQRRTGQPLQFRW